MPGPRRTLRADSLARLASLVARAAFALVSTIATARLLGPKSKGTLSSLLFVATILSFVCSLGLGDAAVVMVGRRQATAQRALSATIAPVAAATIVGSALIVAVAWIADWGTISGAVAATAALLAVSTAAYILSGLGNAIGEVTYTATAWGVAGALGTVATIVFVGPLDLDILGGVLGVATGSFAMLLMLASRLRQQGLCFEPATDRPYLSKALRFSSLNEATFLLSVLAERADLLLVYALLGEADTGNYAVALALGRLPVYAASAVAGASFPRLASTASHGAGALIARTTRLVVMASALLSLALVATMPVLVELLFGSQYEDSVPVALLLAIAAPLVSMQVMLTKAISARGEPHVSLISFLVSVATMVALDVLLLPAHGLVAAGIASLAGAAAGAATAARGLSRRGLLAVTDLLIRSGDARELVRLVRSAV